MNILEQRLASVDKLSMSSEQCVSDEYIDELRRKIQSQVITLYFSLLYQNGLMDSKVLVVDRLASFKCSAIIEVHSYASVYFPWFIYSFMLYYSPFFLSLYDLTGTWYILSFATSLSNS